MNWLAKIFKRKSRPLVCSHVYSEVPDHEQADPSLSMSVAVMNLYSYDVRCELCERRTRISSADYAKNLRDTGRMQ